MKKYILSLLIVAITASVGLAQAPASITAKNEIIDGKRQGYWQLSALFLKMPSPWLPQQIVEQGNYDKSLKTGLWTRFFQNGKTESELTYVNNRANGPAKTYFESGQLREEGTWVGTRWTGSYTLYYDNGNVRQQFKYDKLGVRNDTQKYFHPNGELAIVVNIVNGKEQGWQKEYNANGELIKETWHNAGVIDPAKTKEYHPVVKVNPIDVKPPEEIKNEKKKAPRVDPATGQVSKEGLFDGEGFWILVDKNDRITYKGTFKNYQLIDGEERIYNTAGFCTRVKEYKNGKYYGEGIVPKESTTN